MNLKVCFVSSIEPRHCGIAAFTQSIVDHLPIPPEDISLVAISDKKDFYRYGPTVIAEIIEDDLESYVQAAQVLNASDVDIVCLQHVFSLFGGKNGENIVHFLKKLQKPVVTTLHMVYSKQNHPNSLEVVDSEYSEITHEIIKRSQKIVVMTEFMAQLLIDQYALPEEKIEVIPHGAPLIPQQDSTQYKKKLGLEKNKIISSFGLIRPKKGLEHIIRAMPKILKKYPETKLLILGESHPNRSPEYYQSLIQEAKDMHLYGKEIIFKDTYLTLREIIDYLFATDIFVTPYLVPEQTSSGAIAYAMACGKAIISTPFAYAKETLADKRGLFANFADPESLFRAVDFFFMNPEKRKRMEELALKYATKNSFQQTGKRYLETFVNVSDNLQLK